MSIEARSAAIVVDGETIQIETLTLQDPTLASLLRREPEDQWDEILIRALTVGARGLASMGLGVDLDEVDLRMERSVRRLTEQAQHQADQVLEAARRGMRAELDPEVRSSIMARSLDELHVWQRDFLEAMDPARSDSHSARLVKSLHEVLGPNGLLEARITELLDPDSDSSAFHHLTSLVNDRFVEMRDLFMRAEGATAEADRGTRKGFEFEDILEEALREAAVRLPGAYVERTTTDAGSLDAASKVGDFVVTTGTGHRIVIEAKNVATISVHGRSGILSELDQAMANRRADFAICVSAQDAFPTEVGAFRPDGNRLLVVDDGTGILLAIALQWALASLVTDSPTTARIDTALVKDRLTRLRSLARQFSNTQRSLTKISSSVTSVQADLAEMRTELLTVADDIALELGRAVAGDEEPRESISLRAVAEHN